MKRRTATLAAFTLAVFAAGWFGAQIVYNQGAPLFAGESKVASATIEKNAEDDKKIATACAPGGVCPHNEAAAANKVEKSFAAKSGGACSSGEACSYPETASSEAVKKRDLSADEQKVFGYMMHEITENKKGAFEGEEIEAATGVSGKKLNFARIRSAIMDELAAIKFDTSCLTGASADNCNKFSACSVDRNLNGANGEELERYAAEKADDGKTYTGWRAPDFSVPATTGNTVTLSNLRGKPVALTLLAMHCYHSMDTMPILGKLHKKYAAKGIEFLPIFVNTTVEDVRELMKSYDVDFAVGAAQDKAISGLYKARMVPSTFLIDAEGFVTQKFVGFQNEEKLDAIFAAFTGSNTDAVSVGE